MDMLETYFSASKLLVHLRSGPSGPYLDRFAATLERQGYSADTAVRYLRAAAHLGHDEFQPYLRERLTAYPGLSAVRLLRELRERGFGGGYTAVKRAVAEIRPERERRFEVRFET